MGKNTMSKVKKTKNKNKHKLHKKNINNAPSKHKRTPRRESAINLVDNIIISTDLLKKKRREDKADYEYAFVATKPLEITSAQHDFSRELAFMKQAEDGAREVFERLKDLKIPTQVPIDFRAEKLKDDRQMKKVTDKLKDKREAIERSEKVRKLRDLKKMGKKIQEEVLRKRHKQKRETLEQISKYKRGEATNVLD